MTALDTKSFSSLRPRTAAGTLDAPESAVGRREPSPAGGPGRDRPPVDLARISRAVREILVAIGEDPDRPGLLETPGRVARAYAELFAGLQQDAAAHLERVFPDEGGGVVIVRDIALFSMCEHHLLPFWGRAHVAYLPNGREVVGLSKLARTVEVFARRPQVQERLTNQIADAIEEHLDATGVCVIVEAEHMCMMMRGAAKPGSLTKTCALRGVYREDAEQRNTMMNLLTGR